MLAGSGAEINRCCCALPYGSDQKEERRVLLRGRQAIVDESNSVCGEDYGRTEYSNSKHHVRHNDHWDREPCAYCDGVVCDDSADYSIGGTADESARV